MSAQKHVVTTHTGTNADLIKEVARLYLSDGALVADVTYGKGHFWTKCDLARVTLLGSDLRVDDVRSPQLPLVATPGPWLLVADFRALPYRSGSLDVVVLDPPYMHYPANHLRNNRYRNCETTQGMSHARILRELYCLGIQEAYRVLKPGGLLWVKGKDEIERGQQCWAESEIRIAAERCGFTTRDQFVFVAQGTISTLFFAAHTQRHARKNHSYLWVFERDTGTLLPPRGRPKKGSASTTLNGQRGTVYLQARLLRDSPEIFARYQAGEFASVHAAAVAAGLLQRRARATARPAVQARGA